MNDAMQNLVDAGLVPDDDDGGEYAETDLVLMGRPPAAKFDAVGDLVQGRVLHVSARQARDYKTGDPKFYKDGDKIMEMVIILRTSEGSRTLYAGRSVLQAIREAIMEINLNRPAAKQVTGIRPGGDLAVRRIEDGKPAGKGMNAPHQHHAAYDPPGRKPIPPLPDVSGSQASLPDDGPPF